MLGAESIPALSANEQAVFEAEMFVKICAGLMEMMRIENKPYFRMLKLSTQKEDIMIETNFIRHIINDILATREYTLPGIAYYTDLPEEVILEVVTGQNTAPTLSLSQKLIQLHRSVRPQLYHSIMAKVMNVGVSGHVGAAGV